MSDRVTLEGREGELLRVTGTGYLLASIENLEFVDTVEGGVINSNQWTQSTSGMTITNNGNSYNLNPTLVTTANAYANLVTIQSFTYNNMKPLYVRWSQFASLLNLDANCIIEVGFGTVATNATPTDGMYLRFTNGKAYMVQNNSGVEVFQQIDLPNPNTTEEFFFFLYGTKVKFYKENKGLMFNGALVYEMSAPKNQATLTNSGRASFFIRVRNGAAITATPSTFNLGQVAIGNLNSILNKCHGDRLVGYGRGAWQSPITPFAKLQNWVNNTAPVAATLSNTAAGYTTLGGDFQFAAVNGAETDYALFGYQVPPGMQLYISEINISAYNFGAIGSAVTPTILEWGIALNQSAISLATADNFATAVFGPRPIKLGVQSFPISAVIGAVANYIVRQFTEGKPACEGNRFVVILVKIPVGVNTASEFIRVCVGITGYFE